MATKTISLSEDAYERLKAEKKENESFSDAVARITTPVKLDDFHGILSDETADDLEEAIEENRKRFNEEHRERVEEIKEAL
ncbi:MAG: antitoxin VapB family protein [Candidatus Nanohaloarchaea archaeon]|nr:antitoxin VapB family protein [Candidatus Nanohaloarchaea archaeon]